MANFNVNRVGNFIHTQVDVWELKAFLNGRQLRCFKIFEKASFLLPIDIDIFISDCKRWNVKYVLIAEDIGDDGCYVYSLDLPGNGMADEYKKGNRAFE